MAATETQIQRDENFYFAFRTFQVEDTLFRVPRHLFLMPEADIHPIPQETDTGDDLVVLGADIKKDDFRQLVRALYPRKYNQPENLNVEEWKSVLKLSRAFKLDEIRRKAAQELKDVYFAGDPIEALFCAKENNLEEWFEPCAEKLANSTRQPTEEELTRLGNRLILLIGKAEGRVQERAKRRK